METSWFGEMILVNISHVFVRPFKESETVQGHCSPIKAVHQTQAIVWHLVASVTLLSSSGAISGTRTGCGQRRTDGPIVVLHGDVYSKSAEKCHRFDDYCLNPKNCLEKNEKVNEEESVRSNLLDNNNDVPPLPHQASMLGPDCGGSPQELHWKVRN